MLGSSRAHQFLNSLSPAKKMSSVHILTEFTKPALTLPFTIMKKSSVEHVCHYRMVEDNESDTHNDEEPGSILSHFLSARSSHIYLYLKKVVV